MIEAPALAAQITWVYTDDVESAARFYRDVLGLECVRDQGIAKIFSVTDGARIGVCRVFEDRVVEPRGGMISLVTDDVDAWYRRLVAAGTRVRCKPRRLGRFGIYTFLAEDPSGYLIEFQQFVDD